MLNEEAFAMFIAYRKQIRKPVKPVSENALRIKLEKMGSVEVQLECVNRSISNSWQGLFEPDKNTTKRAFEPVVKTPKQMEFDNAQMQSANERSTAFWNKLEPTPLNSLKKCEAILSRYNVTGDSLNVDKMTRLSEVVAGHIRNCDPTDVLGEPNLHVMVRQLFKEAGVRRLKERAAA